MKKDPEMSEDDILRAIASSRGDIPHYEQIKREGVVKIKLPEPIVSFREQIEDPENNPFPTLSGKIEIYSQELADMNSSIMPPVPKYIEPWEGPNDPLTKKYPLQLITTHINRRVHTQYELLPWLRELDPQVLLAQTAKHGLVGRLDPLDLERGVLGQHLLERVAELRLGALARALDRQPEHGLGQDHMPLRYLPSWEQKSLRLKA